MTSPDLRLITGLRIRVGRLLCAALQHRWRYEPAQHVHGRCYGPFRVCPRCQDVGLLSPPGDGHPESLDRDLPREQEALLAELDAALFPDDADRPWTGWP